MVIKQIAPVVQKVVAIVQEASPVVKRGCSCDRESRLPEKKYAAVIKNDLSVVKEVDPPDSTLPPKAMQIY